MTTRSGLVGVITGSLAAMIIHIIISVWPDAVISMGVMVKIHWAVKGFIIILFAMTGYVAAKWNRSVERWRCTALGSLAGGIAGFFLFSLWGASFSVLQPWALSANYSQIMKTGYLIQFTIAFFLQLFLAGTLFGSLGGFLVQPHKTKEEDKFNKDEPQMAMNAAITAVPSSVVAAAIAAYAFPRLLAMMNGHHPIRPVFCFPIYAALVLVVVSQFALTLVVPHETEQAEHVSGMDEVKMAAFVSIGTAPLTVLLFAIINARLLSDLFVIILLAASMYMSIYSIRSLIKWVLPKRKSYPSHATKTQGKQAALFGSIARSKAWRLVTLCIGCGMAMVFPIYITVLAPLININTLSKIENVSVAGVSAHLYWLHIKTGMGLNLIVILVLSAMYIFYLNLGRWFYKKQTSDPLHSTRD
jgi:hypothetical protein